MKNLKTKKRLSALAIVFMLTFLVGAAFAALPGTLEITTNAVFRPVDLYVIWSDVESELPIAPLFIAEGNVVVSEAEIRSGVDANGRTGQFIDWNITFSGAGTARMWGMAENIGAIDANIGIPAYSWVVGDLAPAAAGALMTQLGVSVDVDGSFFFTGLLPVGEETVGMLEAEVVWNGNAPDGWNSNFFDTNTEFTATLRIMVDYTAAP